MRRLLCRLLGHWWRNPHQIDGAWHQTCRCCRYTTEMTQEELRAWVDQGGDLDPPQDLRRTAPIITAAFVILWMAAHWETLTWLK